MTFGGFQKLTLLDFPGKVACTVFTKACNFLCPFCHNAPLVNKLDSASSFSDDEILSFLKKRQGVLEGVCITGGEPLLHGELIDFIKKLKSLGYKVKVDTNGTFPERLKELVNGDLVDYVAMDIKNSIEKYSSTAGVMSPKLDKINESVRFLIESGIDFEFRTTVVRELHEVRDIEMIAEWISGAPRYFLQNFVDSGDIIRSGFTAHSHETMEEMRLRASVYVPDTQIRGI